MKKFLLSMLGITMLFMALGVIADGVSAKFRSDAKALDLVAKARIALGGDAALAEVNNLVIKGRSTHNFEINGVARSESGETEITLGLNGVLARNVSIGDKSLIEGRAIATEMSQTVVVTGRNGQPIELDANGEFTAADGSRVIVKRAGDGAVPAQAITVFKKADGAGEITEIEGRAIAVRQIEGTEAAGEKKIFVRRTDGADGVYEIQNGEMNVEGKRVMVRGVPAHHGGNELARMSLMLLLTTPNGVDVTYTFEGENTIEGTIVNTVNAAFSGSSIKLHLDKYSNLPVAVDYTEAAVRTIVRAAKADGGEILTDNIEGRIAVAGFGTTGAGIERRVKLSDFRSVNNVQLPHRWTTYSKGDVVENFEVTSYEVNAANLTEGPHKMRLMKMEK